MLSGQEIGFVESLWISLVGMGVVMLELAILAIFILVMSKLLIKATSKPEEKKAEVASLPTVPTQQDISDEEFAAILVSVCAQSGYRPEQISIRSIVQV